MKAARVAIDQMRAILPAYEEDRSGIAQASAEIIARAILAERERSARIAASWVRRAMHLSPDGYELERTYGYMGEEAAAAIRKGDAS
jgi:hypothetical protein